MSKGSKELFSELRKKFDKLSDPSDAAFEKGLSRKLSRKHKLSRSALPWLHVSLRGGVSEWSKIRPAQKRRKWPSKALLFSRLSAILSVERSLCPLRFGRKAGSSYTSRGVYGFLLLPSYPAPAILGLGVVAP